MTRLFFDIESVPIYESDEKFSDVAKKIESGEVSKTNNRNEYYKFENGALNPYEGKTIAISYQIADELIILKEWDNSEKDILQKFFNVIDEETRKGWEINKPLTLVGFNISKFDIPFLFERMKINKVISSSYTSHDPIWLFKKLFAFHVDLMQTHIHLNGFEGKGITHNTIAKAYGFPPKEMKGNELAKFYYKRDFQKIEDYIKREFIYPKLLQKMEEGLIPKDKILKLIEEELSQRASK